MRTVDATALAGAAIGQGILDGHASRVLPNGFAIGPHGRPVIGGDDRSLYAWAALLRATEELILDLFSRGLVAGTTHTCLGQELCQLSVVRALSHPEDIVLSNHRNHGHFLTFAGDVVGLVGEITGRACGVCGGYGGSQHLAWGGFHSNGIQAGMTAIGVGQALAIRQRDSQAMVTVIVGDGTLGEGLLYESLNLASVWALPVLYVVENNGIAQTTDTRHTIGGSIEARGLAFGLHTRRLDDADADFCAEVERYIAQRRAAGGPAMLVIDTGRLGPHSKGDDLRTAAERQRIAQRDPLAALGLRIPASDRSHIDAQIARYLAGVEHTVLGSPEPVLTRAPAHALRPATAIDATLPECPPRSVRSALTQALRHLLTHHPNTVLIGEDLHDPYGGAFKVTSGLSSEFPGRVISTPISEAGITGAGIGAALSGLRPIVEIMFADFLTLCADQLYNHAVKFPGLFPACSVPLVIRAPSGARRGYGPTHSQSPENILVSIPGLTVVCPSQRHAVDRLLVNASTAWPNPTVFLEHKLLYGETMDPGPFTPIAAGPGDLGADLFPTLSAGEDDPDITLVAFGGMVPLAERAAATLRAHAALRVRIVVPALLAPLPRESLIDRLIDDACVFIVEESHHEFGVAAELLASLAEVGYAGVAARAGTPPVPIASARSLERGQLLDEQAIVAHALALLAELAPGAALP